MIPEKAEGGGGGVNKKAKDEIFSYIKSARLSSISPRIYHIYKKNLQNVCIMKRRAKKKRKGGVYNVSTQNLFTLRFDEI